MEELLKLLSPFGIGGILAGFIFWYYRQDRMLSETRLINEHKETREWVDSAHIALTELVKVQQVQVKDASDIQRRHIEILSELTTWLKAKNGK